MSQAQNTPHTLRGVVLWTLVAFIAVASIGAMAGQFYFYPLRTYYIPSGSMIPTLLIGDRIFVRVVSPFCPTLVVERGDIVLIQGSEDKFVRRVVGLAGDRIRVDNRGLEVNGERVTGPILRTIESEIRGTPVSYDVAEERFAQTSAWTVHAISPGNWGPSYEGIVPEGHVFALGDNRASSNDDRLRGPTPVDAIVGRALRVPFSLSETPNPPWRNLRVRPGPSCASS